MSFEGQRIYATNQSLNGQQNNEENRSEQASYEDAELKFQHLIQEVQEKNTYIYRQQLKENSSKGKYYITVKMDDIINFDEELAIMIRQNPIKYIELFENAVQKVYEKNYYNPDDYENEYNPSSVPKFQVQLQSDENVRMLRDLQSSLVNQLVVIPGIITSASKTNIKAKKVVVKCQNCGHEKILSQPYGFGGVQIPRQCDNSKSNDQGKSNCQLDSYQIITTKCEYIDQQILKIQEAPELIPTGEMPRTFLMTCDRQLCDRVTPGNRVKVIGILRVMQKSHGGDTMNSSKQMTNHIRISYIRVLGIMNISNKDGSTQSFTLPTITQEDEEIIQNMSKDPLIFQKMSRSIASAIYGHEDIKKALACLLFGGSTKKLPDGMKLRGDINILLLGDPSTAKSQFLKFVERVAPISVYTSGKGSSAAGLTASVIRDGQSGEFQLEGGAMVLADGGVVCIDEFDKMRPQDRVAIHEAMEQQTISIAKAGITTILNSRTSVLAAANPVFGRYDDLKHAAEQIEFQSSILSRFDCIFIVRDIREENADKLIASHVVSLHMYQRGGLENQNADFSIEDLKKYIAYAKMKVHPRLNEESGHLLQDLYVKDRQNSKEQNVSKKNSGIPITVRQLEAIIRLSESIAKIHLCDQVKSHHVEEAHRIFKISTLHAAASGMSSKNVETPSDLMPIIRKVEDAIKRRVAIGTKVSYAKLQQEMMQRFENLKAIDFAILGMVKREEFSHQEGKKILVRKK